MRFVILGLLGLAFMSCITGCSSDFSRVDTNFIKSWSQTSEGAGKTAESPKDRLIVRNISSANHQVHETRYGGKEMVVTAGTLSDRSKWSVCGRSGVSIGPVIVIQTAKSTTVDEVAKAYSVPVAVIKKINKFISSSLRPGQCVVLPFHGRSWPRFNVDHLPNGLNATSVKEFDLANKREWRHSKIEEDFQSPFLALRHKKRFMLKATVLGSSFDNVANKRNCFDIPANGPFRKDKQRSVLSELSFRWPLIGRVARNFGERVDGNNLTRGMSFAVPIGANIMSIERGDVIYAGQGVEGYGKIVLIRHAKDWISAYAHASKILVRKRDEVRRGQVIAYAGVSGNALYPQLYFELRKSNQPVNPKDYICP